MSLYDPRAMDFAGVFQSHEEEFEVFWRNSSDDFREGWYWSESVVIDHPGYGPFKTSKSAFESACTEIGTSQIN